MTSKEILVCRLLAPIEPVVLMSQDAKFLVKVYPVEKPAKVSKETQQQFKGALSGKMAARMKKEAIQCPVLGKERPFLDCFVCPNFLRRVRGEVHCLGEPLFPQGPPTPAT